MNMPLRAAQDAKTLGERADESKLWLVAAALAVGLLPALLANYAPSLGKLGFPATSVHGEDAAIPPRSFAWVKPHDLDGVSERSVQQGQKSGQESSLLDFGGPVSLQVILLTQFRIRSIISCASGCDSTLCGLW